MVQVKSKRQKKVNAKKMWLQCGEQRRLMPACASQRQANSLSLLSCDGCEQLNCGQRKHNNRLASSQQPPCMKIDVPPRPKGEGRPNKRFKPGDKEGELHNKSNKVPKLPHKEQSKASWNVRDSKWLENLNELKKYRSEHGDCVVPRGYACNPSLGTWVAEQR